MIFDFSDESHRARVDSALLAFCAHMPASTASNFDRVFGPLWIVLAEREREDVPRDGKVPLKSALMIGRSDALLQFHTIRDEETFRVTHSCISQAIVL